VSGTAVSRSVYNGTTAASLTGGTLVGVVNGDTVSLTQAGTYASKNPGSGIAVTAADVLSGASAGNYSITQPVGLTGTITPDSLTVTGTVVGSKVYNGTSSAPLTGGTLVGVVPGDSVTLIQSGTFASTNAGSGIAVTVADSLSGPNAVDYSIREPVGLTGTISPATPAPTSTPTSPSAPAQVAQSATTQVQSSFASPQLGSSPQSISALPTMGAMSVPTGGATASSTTTNSAPAAGGGTTASSTPDSSTASATTTASAGGGDATASSTDTSTATASSGSSSSSGASSTGDSSSAAPVKQKAIAVNVSMKIGATGTLTIQSGGLRLPGNLTVDNQ
jgi:hypothetical protein